jgi:glycosyltransferase involved in cell wall biosynthesis
MKKVVFISSEASLKGGGETFLFDALCGLNGAFTVACICPAEGALAIALRQQNVPVIISKTTWGRKWYSALSNHWRLGLLGFKLISYRPDLIYANAGHVGSLAVRLGKKLGIPTIIHVHDLFTITKKDKYSFRGAQRVIVCSQAVKNLVSHYTDKISLIHNGISLDKFSPTSPENAIAFRHQLNVPEDTILVGYMGTLIAKKGIFDFIEMAVIISRIMPKVCFVIAGMPKAQEPALIIDLKKRIDELGLTQRFIWLGFLSRPEDVLPCLDVFVFPSHYEAFGRVIIEAMACGVPVVTTDCEGPLEIIEDGVTGLVCPCRNPQAMAQRVLGLLKDKGLMRKLSIQGRAYVKDKFNIHRMIAQMRDMIQETIGKK